LSTFASDQPRFIAPVKGTGQLKVLLNGVYDLDSTRRSADYPAAVDQLLARQKRRALVVLVTNVRDEVDEELLTAMTQLGRQHRVLIASLYEERLEHVRLTPVQSLTEALAYCATVDYLNGTARLHEQLRTHGLPIINARPTELGAELVARYLAWKKGEAL
jgi:uncharacterized protein (DUF58 family)